MSKVYIPTFIELFKGIHYFEDCCEYKVIGAFTTYDKAFDALINYILTDEIHHIIDDLTKSSIIHYSEENYKLFVDRFKNNITNMDKLVKYCENNINEYYKDWNFYIDVKDVDVNEYNTDEYFCYKEN